MKYMKLAALGSLLLWGFTLVGGDGTLPFGDKMKPPFAMEGVTLDPLNPLFSEPLEVSFVEPELIDVTPADTPLANPNDLAVLSTGDVLCPLGMELFDAAGSVTRGLDLDAVVYDVVAVCSAPEDALEKKRMIIASSDDDGAFVLEGVEVSDAEENLFIGDIRLEVATDAPTGSGLTFELVPPQEETVQ